MGITRKALLILSLGLFLFIQPRGVCWSQTTTLVSVDSVGAQDPDPSSSQSPSISSNGRYVAFESDADDLVAGDTLGFIDVFVHDRDADGNGTYDDPAPGGISTVRVSEVSGGGEANGESISPSISSNGRYVAFESNSTNLAAGDTNPFPFYDIFVHDLQTGVTTLVSVDSAGNQDPLPSTSSSPSLSSTGRYVAFDSDAQLVGSDDNGTFDIFVHDRDADGNGTYDDPGGISTVRVSVDSAGNQATEASVDPSISSDGRYVAFESAAHNLVAGDTPVALGGFIDIFVHDRDADGNGTYDDPAPGGISTVRVSEVSGGGEANGESISPSISADGRYVAFQSQADNLIVDDTNPSPRYDIFVHDLQTGVITLVSVDSKGIQGNGDSNFPSISSDGRYVAFMSDAPNLVDDDTNGNADIFVHDRDADGNGTYDEPGPGSVSTVRVSVNSAGDEGNGDSSAPSISADGLHVAFESDANDLVVSDTNPLSDIFVYEQDSLPPTVDSTTPAHNANGVDIGSSITATFSEPMNGSTIDTNTFTMNNGVTGTVAYDVNSVTATFTPSSNLDYLTTYTATITTGAEDLAGNPMQTDYTWSFTTQHETLPPTVNATSPVHNANGVGIGSSITATFSEPMNGSTIDTNTFTMSNGVTGTVAYDAISATARFTPTGNLHYNTRYTATITTAAEDLAGNPMPADYTWSFTTESEKNNSSVSISCFITAASDWADF